MEYTDLYYNDLTSLTEIDNRSEILHGKRPVFKKNRKKGSNLTPKKKNRK
jgi:hypothetical protein